MKGPAGIWTRIIGFKVQCDNHYTTGPYELNEKKLNKLKKMNYFLFFKEKRIN